MARVKRARPIAPALVVSLVDDLERRRALAARFWRHVRRGDDPRACWLWSAAVSTRWGAPRFRLDSTRDILGARMSWLLLRGPIPVGCDVQRTCPEVRCVNPAHRRLHPDVRDVGTFPQPRRRKERREEEAA